MGLNTESRSVDIVIRINEIKVLRRMIAVKHIVECGLSPPEALISLEPDVRGWQLEDMTLDL